MTLFADSIRSLFLSRYIEIYEFALETLGLPGSVSNPCNHPDGSHNHGQLRQVDPDKQTNDETEDRRNQLPQRAVLAANVVMRERCQIHAHERDQRPEIEQLSAIVVG